MKCAIFCANGFEECEALIVVDMLRRASIEIETISMNETNEVISSHNVKIITDEIFDETNLREYDVLILPGGMPGTTALKENTKLQNALIKHDGQAKLICAICAAPSILGQLGLLKGKRATCYPGYEKFCLDAIMVPDKVVKDDNIITAKGLGAAFEFASIIIETITDKDTAVSIIEQIQY